MILPGRHTNVPDDVDCNVSLFFGHFCSIADGLRIVSGQHPSVPHPEAVSTFPFYEWGWNDEYPPCDNGGQVRVGSDVWIGQDVSIMVGVTIADGATIAARSVVVKDVPPYAVVAGNPAEVKKQRFTATQITRLLEIAWWTWPDAKIKEALPVMANIEDFLRLPWTG